MADSSQPHPPLRGKICLVAGASRGVGRGIARGLGEAGASVIVTGRSSEGGPITEGRKETVEDTARLVSAAGGAGYPYRCDHTSEREIDQLASWTLRRFGRLEVLVCCIWGGNEGYDGSRYADGSTYGTPFWRRPAARLGEVLETGLYANFLTLRAFAPAMAGARKGLALLVTYADGDSYIGDVFYDLAKTMQRRLAFIAARELEPYNVTALALAPGRVRTERMGDADAATLARESPLYAGRAAAALAADPDVARFAGQTLYAAECAERYGFTDEDGSRPARFRVSS